MGDYAIATNANANALLLAFWQRLHTISAYLQMG
jgi:hypothetical protein